MKRMSLCPRYFRTDAVRLLGLTVDCIEELSDENATCNTVVEEVCKRGIFEADVDEFQYRPSSEARYRTGAVRDVFQRYRYTLKRCTKYLIPYIEPGGEPISENRIFSATSFFNHRHEAAQQIEEEAEGTNRCTNDKGLQMLVWLFLFGISVERNMAEGVLGKADLDSLSVAGLIRQSPVRTSDIVGEVQIFPVSPSDLCGTEDVLVDDCSFFVTDFPMESMRLPSNAVMPVGHDTLELLCLSADAKHCVKGRILDLCCGSGIQGIFAMWCSLYEYGLDGFDEVVLADINERAIYFTTANLALNAIRQGGPGTGLAHAVCGNLFDSLSSNDQNKFDHILSNPPFVAVPSYHASSQLQPALYAVGGGADGMHILRRILANCFDFLRSGDKSMMLMVTEVPNVQESCNMLRALLPEERRDRARLRVAYVEDDVEEVAEYSRERESETGIECSTRNWSSAMTNNGVYNRALALISISRVRGDDLDGIRCFSGDDHDGCGNEGDYTAGDEEDAFLRPEGITYARRALL